MRRNKDFIKVLSVIAIIRNRFRSKNTFLLDFMYSEFRILRHLN